jgi:8-oxo-dGTP pyrophosphatase MutT (NUDIX family)
VRIRFEQLTRRGLHLYWRFSRGLTLGVRGAAIAGDNRIFLVRHTYTPGWQMPGGGVEAGEAAVEALVREMREEAALEIAGTPRLHGVFFHGGVSRRDHVLVFVAREFEVLAPKKPDREIAEASFFPLDRLPEGTTRATRARIAEIAGGHPPAVLW